MAIKLEGQIENQEAESFWQAVACLENPDEVKRFLRDVLTLEELQEAVRRALTNPLLDVSYQGATGALIHVTGGDDLTLDEVNRIGEMVTEALDPDANVIWGARISPNMNGKLRVMTIVTGVNSPYILGKADRTKPSTSAMKMSSELGIDMITSRRR